MESIYRCKKQIIRIAYISLSFMILLALNFTALSGTPPNGGRLEVITDSQSIVLNYSILTDIYGWEKIKDTYSKKNVKGNGSSGTVDGCIFLLFIYLIWRYKSRSFWRRRYTLVSLCVRMDE